MKSELRKGAVGLTSIPSCSPGSSREAASQAAALFRTLGDATRALIVLTLGSEERSLSVLAHDLGMTPPAVSHHLQLLSRQGLVCSNRVGREVFYRIDVSRLRQDVQRALGSIDLGSVATKRAVPVLIGSALPLTGFAAADGLEQSRALTLAVEEWNARGGVQGRRIDQVVVDVGEMSRKRMMHCFRKLTEEHHVDAIVNGYLVHTGKEHEIVTQSSTPYVHCNTSHLNQQMYGASPQKYWMCFQCDPSETVYGFGFPHFLSYIERCGYRPRRRTIAVITASDPYSLRIAQTLRGALANVGWRVCLFERVQAPYDQWGPILDKVMAARPDVIFLSDVVLEDNIGFVEEFLKNPSRSLLYGQYAPTLREYVVALGPQADGTITSTVGGILPGPIGKQYASSYLKRWGVLPGTSIGGLLYDAVNLYLMAVALADGPEDRRKVCEHLGNLWVKGTTGVRRFTAGHVMPSYPTQTRDPASGMPHVVSQIQHGQSKILYPPPYAEAPFAPPPWFAA